MLRIPEDKLHKPHNDCTNIAEKASPSGKNKLRLGVSWAQVVDERVTAIQNNASGAAVASSAFDRAKTKHPTLN